MLDNIFDSGILPNTSHANAVGVIAPQILHEHVGGIWLGSEAVISHLNPRICDSETVHVERIKTVGILGLGLKVSAFSLSPWGRTNGCVRGKGSYKHVVKGYIPRLHEEVGPAR